MLGIHWAGTQNFIYAPLLVLVAVVLIYRMWLWHRVVAYLAADKQVAHVLPGFSYTRRVVRSLLFFIGTLFLFIALLRPQWHKRDEVIQQEGRDLFIALDISRSMLANDCVPDRLRCAKSKIKDLVRSLSCERVGLILFSGSTFVQCPLTTDYGAFYLFLDQIDAETISSGTTAFDQAIKTALNAFEAAPDRKNKLLVMFTDGEDFSHDLSGVKQRAVDAGMHIFTVGVGTPEGAPVPLFNERGAPVGHQKDAKGGVVISRLNEEILQSLAHDTSGRYVRMTLDNRDMQTIVDSVHSYEKEKFEDRTISRHEEQYPYPLAVSLLCFALEWLL